MKRISPASDQVRPSAQIFYRSGEACSQMVMSTQILRLCRLMLMIRGSLRGLERCSSV